MADTTFSRVVDCPDCHRKCEWCAWYAKNAREAGCGSGSRRKCEWGEQLKGAPCDTCYGAERVRLVGQYERLTEHTCHAMMPPFPGPCAACEDDRKQAVAKDGRSRLRPQQTTARNAGNKKRTHR